MIAIDTRDFCIPSDENDYDELVAFADTIAGIQTHEVIPIDVLDDIKAEIEKDGLSDVNGAKFIFVKRVNEIIEKHISGKDGEP